MTTNSDPTTSSYPSTRGFTKSTPVATPGVSSGNPAKRQKATPSQAVIAQKAYEIWLSRGQEAGCEQKHWFEAERQLRQA
jgi:hypothetical protein